MSYSEALEQQVELMNQWEHLPGWDGQITRRLAYAETYWLSDSVHPLIVAGAKDLPANTTIDLSLAPTPEGFVYLANPIPVKINDGETGRLCAIQWMPARVDPSLGDTVLGRVMQPEAVDTYAVMSYVRSRGAIRPAFLSSWRFGETFKRAIARDVSARAANMSDDDSVTALQGLSLWAAFCLFVQQRILIASRYPAERHARKRLERMGWVGTPAVRVVELRKKQSHTKHAVEPVEREWSCQWVVRGHWRQQYYPSKNQTQSIWITPYVKGPDDKPLRPPRATVFAVVR